MNLLVLDTTLKTAIISLKIDVVILDVNERQSEFLMLKIDELLNRNRLKINDIDVFGVVVGPGSFTGIRVGIATVKAFAYALKKPIVSLTLFDIIVDAVKNGTFLAECTSNSCYFADIKKGKIVNTGVIDKCELIKENNYFVIEEEHFSLSEAYNVNVLTNYSQLLTDQFFKMSTNKQFSMPEPYYIQVSQAERNLEKKND